MCPFWGMGPVPVSGRVSRRGVRETPDPRPGVSGTVSRGSGVLQLLRASVARHPPDLPNSSVPVLHTLGLEVERVVGRVGASSTSLLS